MFHKSTVIMVAYPGLRLAPLSETVICLSRLNRSVTQYLKA
jgi:hypothetical protein